MPASDNLHSGDTITILWRDQNTGTRRATGQWYDRVLITNATTDTTLLDQWVLYNSSSTGDIAPGTSNPRQFTFRLPDGTASVGDIHITVTADIGNHITERSTRDPDDAETNNSIGTRFDVGLSPYPDLVVANVALQSATNPVAPLQSGEFARIRWDSINQGNATSGQFYEYVRVDRIDATDPIHIQVLETVYGNVILSESLPPDSVVLPQIRHHELTFRLPDGTRGAGTFRVVVGTDYYGQNFELSATSNAEANEFVSPIVTSALAAYPDLLATNLTLETANNPVAPLQSGALVRIRWDEVNSGNTTSGEFYDSVRVDRIDDSDPNHVLILETVFASVVQAEPLAANTLGDPHVRHREVTLHLPDGLRGTGRFRVAVFTDVYGQVFEENATGDAEQNEFFSAVKSSTLAAYPDLEVSDISAPATGLSGEEVTLSYRVSNLGNKVAEGPWTDHVFLSDDSQVGSDIFLSSFTYDASLAADPTNPNKPSLVRTEQVRLPSFVTGTWRFIVRTDAGNDLFEQDESNNVAVDLQTIDLPLYLNLLVSSNELSEGQTQSITLTRNAGFGSDLAVSLHSSDVTAVSLPTHITIPAGSSSVVFVISAVDDHFVDGTQTAVVTSSASGYIDGITNFSVLDDDLAMLSVSIAADSFAENVGNPATTATITRNTVVSLPLVVSLISSNTNKLRVPDTITIPAGETSATIPVTAFNNAIIDGTHQVEIVASAAGFVPGSDTVDVSDNDIPTLSLSIDSSVIAEGSSGTTATVTRSLVTTSELTVSLLTDGDIVQVPYSVTIPANRASVSFAIRPVDDDQVDGTQTAIIVARLTTVDGDVLETGAAMGTIDVADNDGPTLRVFIDTDLIAEHGATRATVSRNTSTTEPLVVTLTSDNTTEATVPASLTIPAGQVSVSFIVNGVIDTLVDGAQLVSITAAALGFNSGIDTLTVSDVDLPDLRVSNVTVAPGALFAHDTFRVDWTVSNDGIALAEGAWVDRVFLSQDEFFDGSDLLLGVVAISGPLAVGDGYARSRSFPAPEQLGRFHVLVVTDFNQFVEEGIEHNNEGTSNPLSIAAPYHATVQTDVSVVANGTPIPLSGHVTDLSTGTSAAFQRVSIRVLVSGTRRLINVVSDANGDFSTVFQPLQFEAGRYSIGADHPAVTTDTVQDQFTIVGLSAAPDKLGLRVVPGIPLTGQIKIHNLSDVPLTGLSASVVGAPPNVNVQLLVPSTLNGDATVTLNYTINAVDASELQSLVTLVLSTNEGATLSIPVGVTVVPLTPFLSANPAVLMRGLLRGTQTFVAVNLTNSGGAPTGNLTIGLPNIPWITLVSNSEIASLAPGESTIITLSLNPPADTPLLRFAGEIGVFNNHTGVNIPFDLRVVSEAVGDFQVTVTDNLTFNVAGEPKVQGATVRVLDPYDNSIVIATGTTDETGRVLLPNLPEGTYLIDVHAEKHATSRFTYTIRSGFVNSTEVFIAREVVTYRWIVEPTEIQDHYKITLETTFETNVPAPVVTMEATEIPDLAPGETGQIEFFIVNHGFIAAEQAQLILPEIPGYELTALTTDLGTIPGKSALTVPVAVRRLPLASTTLNSDLSNTSSPKVAPILEVCRLFSASLPFAYYCAGVLQKGVTTQVLAFAATQLILNLACA